MKLNWTRIGLGATGAAILFALTYPAWAPTWCPRNHCFPINEYGDWLAGIAQPIALAWLIAGFWLQRQELALQRQELAQTRAELARQADAASSSDLTSKRALFSSVRPEVEALLNDIMTPTMNWLMSQGHWTLSSTTVVGAVSLNLSSMANDRNPRDWLPTYQAHVRSEGFREQCEHFVRTFSALYRLAEESDGERQTLFRDLLRASVYFGWFRQCLLFLGETHLHPPAMTHQTGDCILDGWNGVPV